MIVFVLDELSVFYDDLRERVKTFWLTPILVCSSCMIKSLKFVMFWVFINKAIALF
jgi:hypothetical protein